MSDTPTLPPRPDDGTRSWTMEQLQARGEGRPTPGEAEETEDVVRRGMNAAVWITCSPHEWTWTQEEQEAMALCCMAMSGRMTVLEKEHRELREALEKATAGIHKARDTEPIPLTHLAMLNELVIQAGDVLYRIRPLTIR